MSRRFWQTIIQRSTWRLIHEPFRQPSKAPSKLHLDYPRLLIQLNESQNVAPSSSACRPSCTKPANHQSIIETRGQQNLRGLQAKQASTMGELELGRLCLHSLLGHSPRNGHSHQSDQISGSGLLDGRTAAECTAMG